MLRWGLAMGVEGGRLVGNWAFLMREGGGEGRTNKIHSGAEDEN